MIIIKIDIVGGSIAGLHTATSIKKRNKSIKVVVHEKHKEIGYNPEGRRCGEAHSVRLEWSEWKPEEKSIFNIIKTVETNMGNKKYILHMPPGISYILNRQEYICQLAREAMSYGAEIRTSDKIKSVDDLDGDYIVDASGCPSSIKMELGLNKGIRGISYQQTLEDSNWFVSDTVRTYFTGNSGYYWIFPRDPAKKEINLGVGLLTNDKVNLKDILEEFKKEHNIQGKINYVLGGLVPSGLQKPVSYKNILFVGDAGVGAFPLTGQGIYRALISADIAGKCIASGHPEKYARTIMQNFIKWDVVGKSFILLNYVLIRVGPKAVLTSLKYFTGFNLAIHHEIPNKLEYTP